MKTNDGWIPGYNVQAAVNGEQVVVAYAATKDHNDGNQLEPMIDATRAAADAPGISGPIGLVLDDAATGPRRARPRIDRTGSSRRPTTGSSVGPHTEQGDFDRAVYTGLVLIGRSC